MALYAFDGTWNVRDSKNVITQVQSPQYGADRAAARDSIETNVSRFKEFYGPDRCEYLEGVGTRFSWLGRIFGGVFGMGGRWRIRRMYRRLTERYFQGDTEINIVGFSRGSALAVHFANAISRHGLRNPANPRHLAWKYYPDLGWTFRHPRATGGDVKSMQIDFLGLFDTVATFGLPIWPFRNRGKWWKVWNIPPNVEGTYHAKALDEVRSTFALIHPRKADNSQILYEVWFRGVHSNIGGGYPDRGLSDIALAWMMEMAVYQWRKMGRKLPPRFEEALEMLSPHPGPPPNWSGSTLESLEPDPNGGLGRPADLKRQAWRAVPDDALVHHTALLREKNNVSDYSLTGRPLLRRIPRSARKVDDPPRIYSDTRLHVASEIAGEIFARVPVRPQPWLKSGEHFIFRSDNWIALGTARGRDDPPVEKTSRAIFLNIATMWLLEGRPAELTNVRIEMPRFESRGQFTDDMPGVIDWVVPVLQALEPYLPVRQAID